MPCVALVIANPTIRTCGNFGVFRVRGCSSEGVAAMWRFWRCSTTGLFSVAKGLKSPLNGVLPSFISYLARCFTIS